MKPRYAIYFAPARHSPWHHFGASWLGRDEHDGSALRQPTLAGVLPCNQTLITWEPARYGFHATLKAPFELRPSRTGGDLSHQMAMLATRLRPVLLGDLHAVQLSSFVALVPAVEPPGLQALAAECVVALDDLRAPLNAERLAHRRSSPLDARQEELLALYGYPHVLERFRFHMTLTGPVAPELAQRVIDFTTPRIMQLNAQAPLWLDRLCLFVEPAPGAPFRRILDIELGTGAGLRLPAHDRDGAQ